MPKITKCLKCLKLLCRFAPFFVKVVDAGSMGAQKSEQ